MRKEEIEWDIRQMVGWGVVVSNGLGTGECGVVWGER
jgi:hypothetical protein